MQVGRNAAFKCRFWFEFNSVSRSKKKIYQKNKKKVIFKSRSLSMDIERHSSFLLCFLIG